MVSPRRAALLVIAGLLLAACGTPTDGTSPTATVSPAISASGCATTVRGVVAAPEHPATGINLPIDPGPIVGATKALAVASTAAVARGAVAKLTSWTEVSALMESNGDKNGHLPSALTTMPWKPVWAVLVNPDRLVVLNAATGRVEDAMSAGTEPSWFGALTNRAQTGTCPGGSTARLPFGVLTRGEEGYMLRNPVPGATGAVVVTLKLTTVPVLNRADPGIFGGCVQQSCSLDELVWLPIVVVHALPGKTIACLPGFASYPAGYKPKQVTEYTMYDIPNGYGIVCTPPTAWMNKLADLAPQATMRSVGGVIPASGEPKGT